jgi:hypothetical protein
MLYHKVQLNWPTVKIQFVSLMNSKCKCVTGKYFSLENAPIVGSQRLQSEKVIANQHVTVILSIILSLLNTYLPCSISGSSQNLQGTSMR